MYCLLTAAPHTWGAHTALELVAKELENAGIDTKTLWVGNKPVSGCTGCRSCKKSGSGRCVIAGDEVNTALELLEGADALVLGSAVHYASVTGAASSFFDRMFYAGKSEHFVHKPGAALVSCRRSGGTAAVDRLNKYFTISQMPVVSSCYWNVVHGNKPDEVLRDLEGVDIMRTLGRNMAYMLRCIQSGRAAGVLPPENTPRTITNFIR